MSDPLAPSPALDAERERAFRLLTDRYADDTITVEEFETRLDRLHAAPNPAAIHAVVADLLRPRGALAPVPPSPFGDGGSAPAPTVRPGAAARPTAGASSVAPYDEPERILAVFSERRLGGARELPARVELRALFGSVVLDLREVALPPFCEIDVECAFAGVEILLPADVELDLRITAILGGVEDHTPPPGPSGRFARLRLSGACALAGVEVRRAPPGLPPGAPFKAAWKDAKKWARQVAKARWG